MRLNEVAIRYARALLLESKNTSSEQKVFEELRLLTEKVFSDPAVMGYFNSPVVTTEKKFEMMASSIKDKGLSPITESFVKLLAQKNRCALIPAISQALIELMDHANGVTRGTVKSVTVLSPEERKRIEDIVTQKTKKRVIMNYVEDPSLVGGLVAQVGGWTFDDSLTSHLRRMNEDLKRRAN